MKRFYSYNDKYERNKACMLEDIFKNNKLEYIYINTYTDKNIVKTMTISSNIDNIRYFYVYNYGRVEITLDIS